MTLQPSTPTAPDPGASLPDGVPAAERPPAPRELSVLGLVEVLLKEPRRLAGRYATTNTEFLARAGVALTGEYGRAARRLAARSRPGTARR